MTTTTINNTARCFHVLQYKLPELQEKIAKLAKRAAKLGVTPPSIKVTGEAFPTTAKDSRGVDVPVVMVPIEIEGEAPVLPGWSLAAVINVLDGEGIIKTLPGVLLPEQFLHTDAQLCEHCNTRRVRNDTFVLQNDDGMTFKQVGRTCLKDFLPEGHFSPDALAWWAHAIDAVVDSCREAGEYDGRGGNPHYISLDGYLSFVACEMREHGWVSRKEAYEKNCTATADIAMSKFTDSFRRTRPSDTDCSLAEKAIEWATGLSDIQTDSSEFLHNIRVLARLGVVDNRTYRIGAAIVSAYQREQDRLAKDSALKPANQRGYHGTVGQRCVFQDCLVMGEPFSFSGNYGTTYIYRFALQGDLVVWYSSNNLNLKPGAKVTLKGTVKAHEVYTPKNGRGESTPQTIITRAVVL